MRIFIGCIEIAGIAATYAKGFRALGHETYTLVTHKNPYYLDAQYDYVVSEHSFASVKGASLLAKITRLVGQKMGLAAQFPEARQTCDLFLFMFGSSFLPGFWDYPLLKQSGKRLVSVFWGSDVRYWRAFAQEMQFLGMEETVRPFIDYIKTLPGNNYRARLRIVRAAEKYADLILSQPGYGQLQRRPYMRANIPLDLSLYRCHIPGREIPVVLHVPSNKDIKGTRYILAAVEQLKSEGVQFDFRLIEHTPNAEVRELLAQADIVVDELFADTVGVLTTEAMAAGNATLVHYPADYAKVPPGCPAVNITRDTLVENLRRVIIDRELRRQLAYTGRPYVEANNDHIKITRQILEWLDPEGIKKYDFSPSFYKRFSPG